MFQAAGGSAPSVESHAASGGEPIAVVTTVGSRDEAMAMAAALVERRLAACVQISEIDSVYMWAGEVRSEPELRLVIKTSFDIYDDVAAAIREQHSYELPAIHALRFDRIDAAYAGWIVDSARGDR